MSAPRAHVRDLSGLVSRRRTDVLTAAAIGAFIVWLAVNHAGLHTREVVSDLAFIAFPGAATVTTWRAAAADDQWRTRWRWISAGCATWTLASVIWTVYELGLDIRAPFPSWADLPYTTWVIPVVVGLCRTPPVRARALSRLRIALDTATIVSALVLTSSILLLHPLLTSNATLLTKLDALGYPLADVTVAAVVLARAQRYDGGYRLRWSLLSVGLLCEAITDSMYVAQTTAGNYAPGRLLDIGWAVSFSLVAASARTSGSREAMRSSEERPNLPTQLLPYVPIVLLAVALMTPAAAPFRMDGRWVWATVACAAVAVIRQVVVVADHVALMRDLNGAVGERTARLAQRERWWSDLVRNLSDVLVVLASDGTVTYCSPAARTALGIEPASLLTSEQLVELVHPADATAAQQELAPVFLGKVRRAWVECRLRRADGEWGWFEVFAVGQTDGTTLTGGVLTLRDVTERRQLTERLSHQAFHDPLTGLPNRALLMDRLDHALQARGAHPALLLLDLDDFKLVNDTHGHPAGDALLEEIGRRLRAAVRAEDTVARLGGDEFAVLLADDLRSYDVARRLVNAVEQPVLHDGLRFVVHASVGGVRVEDAEAESARRLMSHADIALYEAKARGRSSVVIVAGEERERAARTVHLRNEIAAPDVEQFFVVYQPIVEPSTGVIRGLEALLRWQHPQLGLVSPADFIPLAEQSGSISVLGDLVIRTSLRDLGLWGEQHPGHRVAIGVNVSVRQLSDPDFVPRVIAQVDGAGVQRDQLVLEITEQSLAMDFESVVDAVRRLREAGLSVAVDDFGTGYSSLRYLHRFDADVLKIDRSFIANLEGSTHTQKLVRSVVDMCQLLDLQTIAEGVETPGQLALVTELGCELVQGYLFSKPVPFEAVCGMLGRGPMSVPPLPGQRTAPTLGSVASVSP